MATSKSPFATSLAIHLGLAVAVFTTVSVQVQHPLVLRKTPVLLIGPRIVSRIVKIPSPSAGGGGGNRSPLPVSKGQLPKLSPTPFIPPMIKEQPRPSPIEIAPVLMNEPELVAVNLSQWGDPLAHAGPPSNGPGEDGGMGGGKKGGIGDREGARHGPGVGDGPMVPYGSKLTKPEVIYQIDPEFSEEARKAKLNGTVVLIVDVDNMGRVVNIRVARSLGLGLDEKAMEAVSRWKFRPGRRDGKPITVPATIEVSFHLL